MNGLRKVQAAALFMAMLVISLPIYSSQALAVNELNVIRYSGDDNVEGYFGSYDRWVLEANAKVDSDPEITPNQVRVNNYGFMSCSQSSPGYFTCSYTGNYYPVEGRTYPAVFTLVSDSGEVLRTVQKEMTVDSLAPVITFDRQIVQSGSKVSVAYTVKDRAYSENDFTRCSGIKKIEFFDGSVKLNETFPSAPGCIYSGEAQLPAPSSGRITIKAYDKLDHFASEVSSEDDIGSIDNSAPEILTNTFQISKNGVELSGYMSGGSFAADVSITIKERSLDTSKTRADFSAIGGSSNQTATGCTRSGEYNYCTWNGVQASLLSSLTAGARFYAEDMFGNYASAAVTKTFSIDSNPPVVTFLGTKEQHEGKSYGSSVPFDIVMKVSEIGSGISASNVLLDLNDLNPAYPSYQNPDACNNTGNEYVCVWQSKTTTKPEGNTATLYLIDAKDNSGNAALGPSQAAIYIDRTAPRLLNISFRAISEQESAGLASSGDEVIVAAEIEESSGLKAFGDFSSVYDRSGADELMANCQRSGGKYLCTWDISQVMSGYISDIIPLTFVDTAGNTAVGEFPIKIYQREGEEFVPDYWHVSSLELMPPKLDRQTVPLIRQRMYAKIDLASVQGAQLLQMKFAECRGDSGYLADIDVINNQRGSTSPYLMLEFKTFDAKGLNSLNLTCSFEIQSLYNNRISNIELEQVPLNIEFYNMPLGEPSEQLQNKINDLYDAYIDGWWRWIGGLTTLFKYSQLICNIVNIINNIAAIIHNIGDLFRTAEDVSKATPAYAAATAHRRTWDLGSEAAREGGLVSFQALDKFCAFVNCKMSPLPEGERPKKGMFSKFTYYFGGGAGLFGSNTLGKLPFAKDITHYTGKDPITYMNAKDSMLVSMLTLCVPGVIYNLNKYRNIQCMYIDCLQTSLQSGMPVSACDTAKEYATCKYWAGEIFQLIPITAVFNYYLGFIKDILSNPLRMVGAAVGYVCKPAIIGDTWQYKWCAQVYIVSMIAETVEDIIGIFDADTWKVTNDYCHIVEDRGNAAKEAAGTSTTTSSTS